MKKTFAEKQNNVALGVIELYGAKIVPKPDVYFTLTLANGTEAVFFICRNNAKQQLTFHRRHMELSITN